MEGAHAEREKRADPPREKPREGRPADRTEKRVKEDRKENKSRDKRDENPQKKRRERSPLPRASSGTKGLEATTPKSRAEPARNTGVGTRKTSKGRRSLYGEWTHEPDEKDPRPRCLHLFSGPEREGDLAQHLVGKGWVVCSVDKEQPTPTNLLDQGVRKLIIEDIDDGFFDHVHLGTPCETYSALRENPPGPRPLRSATEVEGIKEGLSAQEKKQLREGNEHTNFSGDTMVTCFDSGTSFTLENPEPLNEVSMFNMPKMKEIARRHEVKNVDLDQCVFGAETRKPTRLMYYRVDHESFAGKRCNHPVKEWVDKNGKPYKASHERLVGRKRKTSEGKEEFASKALGHYPWKFCKALADNIAQVKSKRASEARQPPGSDRQA